MEGHRGLTLVADAAGRQILLGYPVPLQDLTDQLQRVPEDLFRVMGHEALAADDLAVRRVDAVRDPSAFLHEDDFGPLRALVDADDVFCHLLLLDRQNGHVRTAGKIDGRFAADAGQDGPARHVPGIDHVHAVGNGFGKPEECFRAALVVFI